MYLVKSALCCMNGDWLNPGVSTELKGISTKFIKWALETGVIEQADGEPDVPGEEVLLADYKGCCGG